ncbi:MAG: DUF2867 domain-containing protein [Candidatus Dadabacteria bacterium]|nr:DUF2867 domain-containing protein [Candidatus Dadabacteria bacterium]NIQ15661.1 DUF2867 domain-containing protein [Candidatus Dadabacteria bacterium]
MSDRKLNILLTGATGYIGGSLLNYLESTNKYNLRCIARKPDYIEPRVDKRTEVVYGDVLDPSSLSDALKNIDVAFYLVHSMGSKQSFEELDRQGAINFGEAAKKCGVKKIIYLGGLGESSKDLSPHLKSRQETGDYLRKSGVEVIEFRSSIVIGSGSLSFELIRNLVEKLPVMTTPKWVYVKTQPISITDVIKYLSKSIKIDFRGNKIIEIGGKDIVSYGDLMNEYARQRNLKRYIIPVPVLTPYISSLWLGLVTPIYARVGKKLIDSLKHQTVVTDHSNDHFFDIETQSVKQAIHTALNEDDKITNIRWSDSMSAGGTFKKWGGMKFGNRIVDHRSINIKSDPKLVFSKVKNVGGKSGWYYANWLWLIRAYIDLVFGGVGIRRGRQNPADIRVGDVIDWWRVEEYEEDKYLKLLAEMKVPGRAWLEFYVEEKDGYTTLNQTAIFDPLGLMGILYWYILYPIHSIIFDGMLRNIKQSVNNNN